jgi:HSP20 family protein
MGRGWAEREGQGDAMERRRSGDLERTGGPIGPFQRMIESVDSMFDQMQRSFFGGPFGTSWGERRGAEDPIQRMARIEVDERDGELILTAELPGIDPNQVHVEARNNVLTIRGERREERSEDQGRRYQSYTSFHRQIPLPPDVDLDKAQASFKHGLLELRLPRKDSGTGTKRIPISTGPPEGQQGSSQSTQDKAA